MWGTVLQRRVVQVDGRFIPTHVGNGHPLPRQAAARTVHPHACGERAVVIPRWIVRRGSSPRMWGTVGDIDVCCLDDRFIPTHVGNGDAPAAVALLAAVHPHACGERRSAVGVPSCFAGSSPRMWGTVTAAAFTHPTERFIPTHVGNGRRSRSIGMRVPVHPHACGERLARLHEVDDGVGSSPRMWGTGLIR